MQVKLGNTTDKGVAMAEGSCLSSGADQMSVAGWNGVKQVGENSDKRERALEWSKGERRQQARWQKWMRTNR